MLKEKKNTLNNNNKIKRDQMHLKNIIKSVLA